MKLDQNEPASQVLKKIVLVRLEAGASSIKTIQAELN